MKQIGIIGAGARALVFVDYLNQHNKCDLKAICDIDFLRTEIFMRLAQIQVEAFANYHDLLNSKDLEAIIITTPDYTHTSIMLDSLRAGKHVLCEKPLATTLNDANQILQAIPQYKNLVCLADLVLRHHSFYQTLLETIPQIGTIRMISANDYVPGAFYFRRWQRLRTKSGGLVLHEGVHSLDIIQLIVKKRVRRVSAAGKLQVYQPKAGAGERCSACDISDECAEYFDFFSDPLRELYETPLQQEGYPRDLCVYTSEKDTHDSVVAHIEYENGPLLIYTLCLFAPLRTREFKFVGDAGMLVCDEASKRLVFYPYGGSQSVEQVVKVPEARYGGGDESLFNEFIYRVELDKPDYKDLLTAIDSNILALAIESSILAQADIWVSRSDDGSFSFSQSNY